MIDLKSCIADILSSALSFAAPIENGVAVEAARRAPCTWFDNLTGR